MGSGVSSAKWTQIFVPYVLLALQPLKIPIFSRFSMDKKPLSDDDFLKRYHSHEKESLDEFIKRYRSTEIELRETIAYLIHHRQLLRDVSLNCCMLKQKHS